jgi:hypothetical protein
MKTSLLSTLIFICLTSTAHAEIYKWKDAQGVVHYGDTMPPQVAGSATTEFNKKGNIVKQNAAALTPEQRAKLAADEAEAAKTKQATIEQKRHDTALLNTYTSPAEIDLARDRSLEQYKLVLTGTNARLTPLRAKQKKLPLKSAEYIETTQRITDLEGIIKKTNQDMADTTAKFDADKAHFIELTGKK